MEYNRKPQKITAIQYDGENAGEIMCMVKGEVYTENHRMTVTDIRKRITFQMPKKDIENNISGFTQYALTPGDYITIDTENNINIYSEVEFNKLYE